MVRNCESAGHGLGSRAPGKVDPGAVGSGTTEAALTEALARHMAENGAAMKVPTLFRNKGPYYLADDDAKRFKATRFREFHFDSAGSGSLASGCTVLVGPNPSDFELRWAALNAKAISDTLGIRNRGVKIRDDLAVLRQYKDMGSILVEVGFMRTDIKRYLNRRIDLEIALVNVDRKMSGLKPVKTLPRTSKNRIYIPKYMKTI